MPNVLTTGRYGPILYPANDVYVGRSIQLYGEYGEEEANLFRQLLRPGDVAIDAGANIGALTVPIARAVGPRGEVHAFEPQRQCFQILCANVALANLENVRCYWAGVGDDDNCLAVPLINHAEPGNYGALRLGHDADWRPRIDRVRYDNVPLVALDRHHRDHPTRLLKIDVEGMELDVLEGAAELIEEHGPFIYLENNSRSHAADLIDWIRRHHYRPYWHVTPIFNPKNFAGNPTDAFPGEGSLNVLCVPEESNARVELEPVTDPFHPGMNP
jgi:FkbM family methyltransferase